MYGESISTHGVGQLSGSALYQLFSLSGVDTALPAGAPAIVGGWGAPSGWSPRSDLVDDGKDGLSDSSESDELDQFINAGKEWVQ